jgi:hypothetical protein
MRCASSGVVLRVLFGYKNTFTWVDEGNRSAADTHDERRIAREPF